MPRLEITVTQQAEVEVAQRESRNVRHWKRYQAVLLQAEGTPTAVVAEILGCSEDSVTNWTSAWCERGVDGIWEGIHPGAARRFDAAGETEFVGAERSARRRIRRHRLDRGAAPHRTDPTRLARQPPYDSPHVASVRLGLEAAPLRARAARAGIRSRKTGGGRASL